MNIMKHLLEFLSHIDLVLNLENPALHKEKRGQMN